MADQLQHGEQDFATNDLQLDKATPQPTLLSSKRSVSGGLLSRFAFLRAADQVDESSVETDAAPPKSKKSIDDEGFDKRAETLQRGTNVSGSSQSLSVKQRKRKGSLRKSALLGGRKFGADGRDRKASPLQSTPTQDQEGLAKHDGHGVSDGVTMVAETSVEPSQAPFAISSASSSRSSLQSTGGVSLPDDDAEDQHVPASRVSSTASTENRADENASTTTTEEDDYIVPSARASKPLPRAISQASITSTIDGSATAKSYFPPQPLLRARSSQRLRPSPLQHAFPPTPEPHSYAETEYWGWVILFVTWLLFTVGMGSCLDIWSWAWDVGETPYAPPELEDDPTLPIVGYYPALIVLTGVVAWVWITVAWVGMKYFRHAKIEV